MGIYSRLVLPRLLDMAMSVPELGSHRRQLLASVTGEVLEIGFGTGANLPYYPKHIKKLTAVDSNAAMRPLALKREAAFGIQVEHYLADAAHLPFASQTFDSVVSSWTLCSVEAVEVALSEIHRVLKPQGKFFFLEHGLCPQPKIQKVQRLINPINRMVAGGCQLTREIGLLVRNAGFQEEHLISFFIEQVPKTHGYMYQGLARKV